MFEYAFADTWTAVAVAGTYAERSTFPEVGMLILAAVNDACLFHTPDWQNYRNSAQTPITAEHDVVSKYVVPTGTTLDINPDIAPGFPIA